MTKIFLDGEETNIKPEDKTWEEVLSKIYELLKGKDRGITNVKADSEDISGIVSGNFPEKKPSDYSKIEFLSEDVNTISNKGIENAINFIPSLKKLILGAANFARKGDEAKMNEAIQASMEGIKLLVTFLINVQTYYKFSAAEIVLSNGKTIEAVMTDLNKTFENFTNAQKNQELTEIADILEYELAEHIDNFSDIFSTIKTKIIDPNKTVN